MVAKGLQQPLARPQLQQTHLRAHHVNAVVAGARPTETVPIETCTRVCVPVRACS